MLEVGWPLPALVELLMLSARSCAARDSRKRMSSPCTGVIAAVLTTGALHRSETDRRMALVMLRQPYPVWGGHPLAAGAAGLDGALSGRNWHHRAGHEALRSA